MILRHPLKLGILGCGAFMTHRILPFLKEIYPIEIVCIHNRNQAKAEAIAKRFNILRAVSTREDLLSDPNVEAVHIASPNFLHEEDALASAKANKPTLCEKPLSISLDSVNRMLTAFKSRSIPFFVGHQLRFKPAIQKARNLCLSKALGRVLHYRAFYNTNSILESDWRLANGNGGVVLQEIGVHLIDLIHFISGEEIVDMCISEPFERIDRTIFAEGRLPSGALVTIECSYESPHSNGFSLIGTEARLEGFGLLRQTEDRIESLRLIRKSGEEIRYSFRGVNAYVEEYRHLSKAIRQGIDSPIRAEISRSSQTVIDAAYGSMLLSYM
jgi:predicted dehydrogenase